ncbi:hypothetical protein GH714_005749 [Hevea brasiliensis]|uniref:Bet v I/Major latex protein domain-containing protein n=1 Tax=Hevea brasiliensis TaxID=3981 RepID=A0A6A6KBV2_HEVBR|nr:hypothetical protein GH714_005749 [Hevea brasiliensis]
MICEGEDKGEETLPEEDTDAKTCEGSAALVILSHGSWELPILSILFNQIAMTFSFQPLKIIGKLTKSNDASDVKSANASDVSSHDGSSKIAMEITEAIDDVNLLTTVKVIKGDPKDYQSFKAIVQATLKW